MSRRFKKPRPITSRLAPPVPSVSLPTPNLALTRFTEYLAAQYNRTTLFLRNQPFADVVAAVDAAYSVASRENQNVSAGRARMYLTCHQAMFSAASSISRGVPLDAAAASRRALEAARTTLAIKLDSENGVRWIAYEERMERWRARNNDEKPPTLKIKYEVLDSDPMGRALARLTGTLSDAAVHFTPEFFSHLDFQIQHDGRLMFSEYLETDEQEIARHLKMFAAIHLLILKTLDRCCDHGLSAVPGFAVAIDGIGTAVRSVYDLYPAKLRPELEEQLAATTADHHSDQAPLGEVGDRA